MKKEILMMFLMIVSMGTFVSAENSGQMLVVGNFEQSTVSILVPDVLELPVAVKGYVSSKDFSISNTGTTDISISTNFMSTTEEPSYPTIFKSLTIGSKNIGESVLVPEYYAAIEKPDLIGGTRNHNIVVNMDLKYAEEENYSDREEVYIVFTAVPI